LGKARAPGVRIVGVQTVAEGIPRILNPQPAAPIPGPRRTPDRPGATLEVLTATS
jgi:hypothetical protein